MPELRAVTPQEKTLLWNLLQKYLCEMTHFYDNDLDADGNYPYRYFEDYFRDSDREALLILSGGSIAGFALLNRHSYIGAQPDRVLGEFFVLPKFRRQHIAVQAAQQVFARHPGSWELKFNTKNLPAAALWTKATQKYHPQLHQYAEYEQVLSFSTEQPAGDSVP